MRIDIDQLMNADTLVYKHTQTNLEKNAELYSKYGVFALATQNGKFVGSTMVLGTKKLNKKSFSGLKTSLFKKDVNVQLYFVRPTFLINICAVNGSYAAGDKTAQFKGVINAKVELSNPEKFVNFVQQFAADKSGIIISERDFAGFIIGAALSEMIPGNQIRPFKPENGNRTHDMYRGNLALRVYFGADKVNRYGAIGLRARSVEIDAVELSY